PRRLAGAKQLERPRVVQRYLLTRERDPTRLADEAQRLMQDGEVPEAEEVELQDAHLVERLVLVLRLDRLGLALRALERHEVRERVAGDDDARGMGAGRAHQTLDLLGEVEQTSDMRLLLHVAQLRHHPARLLEVYAERDDLCHAVGLAVRHP